MDVSPFINIGSPPVPYGSTPLILAASDETARLLYSPLTIRKAGCWMW